tara:strand:- start:10652 stop:11770 length:1119 start_codon:yes stop_codon:yes gene_type:complete
MPPGGFLPSSFVQLEYQDKPNQVLSKRANVLSFCDTPEGRSILVALSHAGTVRQIIRFIDDTHPAEAIKMHSLLMHAKTAVELNDMIPAHLTIDLLEELALCSKRSDIGISFVEYLDIAGFGPVALLFRHCRNFQEIDRVSSKYLRLENGAIFPESLEEDEDHIASVQQVVEHATKGSTQFSLALVALRVRMFREYLDPVWHPVRVDLQNEAPPEAKQIRKYFGCPVAFNADRYAVVISKNDMQAPLSHPDPDTLKFLEHYLDGLKNGWPENLVGQVSSIIESQLSKGLCSLKSVAAGLGISPRSLQRQLNAHDLEFRDLVTEARIRRTDQYFAQTSKPNLTKLSFLLGFAEQSSASRFLKQKMGRNLSSAP